MGLKTQPGRNDADDRARHLDPCPHCRRRDKLFAVWEHWGRRRRIRASCERCGTREWVWEV